MVCGYGRKFVHVAKLYVPIRLRVYHAARGFHGGLPNRGDRVFPRDWDNHDHNDHDNDNDNHDIRLYRGLCLPASV